MRFSIRLTIVQRLALCLFATGFLCAAVILVATRQPWLGLSLVVPPAGEGLLVTAVDPHGPTAGIVAPGARLVAISRNDPAAERIPVESLDLLEEPDTLESYAAFNGFFERQAALRGIVAGGTVSLVLADGGGERTVAVEPQAARPVARLPGIFWYQLGCALIIMIIAFWVTTLRPGNRQAALFAFAGFGAALSIATASIYSTRELALDGQLFSVLSALNHGGATMFAIFMIGLFTVYPADLRLSWVFRASVVIHTAWYVLNTSQVLPDIGLGFYLSVVVAMVTIVALIVLQYRATRNDVRARKALLWLGVSVLVGAGAFSVLMAVPILFDQPAVLSQAHSFGFFPLIYLGVALGLTRYRLFDLERWAFDVLTYVFAAVLFVVIDILLVTLLTVNLSVSAAITAVTIGLIYLPLRNHVVSRIVGGREADPFDLFQASTEIALQPTPEARAQRWQDALRGFFKPLSLEPADAPIQRPAVVEDGAALAVPAYPWSPSLILHHNMGGQRLFGAPHVRVVEKLSHLVSEAERSRRAYDRGVVEERQRIGRDLHDNVGAMLLSSLTAPDGTSARAMVRNALGDIREIINGLSDRRQPLGNIIAELRAETMERLRGRPVAWPAGEADEAAFSLSFPVYRAFTAAHREMISNAIRHADGQAVRISSSLRGGMLVHRVENDLADAATIRPGIGGHGLKNLARRAAELGGSFTFARGDGVAVAEISLPACGEARA